MDENFNNNNDFDFGWPEPPQSAPPAQGTPAAEPIAAQAAEPAPAQQAESTQAPAQAPAASPPPAQEYQNPFAPYTQVWGQQNFQQAPMADAQQFPPQVQPWQQQNFAPAPNDGAAQQTAPPPVKRKKTGLAIFSVFLVLLVCAGAVVGVERYRPGWFEWLRLPGTTQTTELPSVVDNAEMTLQPTPGGLSVSPAEGALSAVEIHEKLKNSNVAIQVYGSGSSSSVIGEGSGILLMEDDSHTYTYVVTCAHVIDGQSKISVELENGENYEATIVASDTRTDIGLLRITKTGLQTAEFGDSSALRVGDTVYAIGNPGGTEFKGSFTEGMVSAIDRPITSTYKQLSIQHTAAINPGNSGGMLVNAAGQVIGINSQKIVDTQYEGMGFAIPSKLVKEVVDDLVKYNRVPNRPKLGIQYLPATQTQLGYEVVRFRNLPSGSLIIAKIDSDSGFNGSDVQKNDIITHVNGQPLTKADLLPSLIENSSVGDTIKLTIVRVSRSYEVTEFDVTVKLVEDKGAAEEATTEAPNLDFFEQYGY